MVSFEQFKIEGSAPIYTQIIEYVHRKIASGEIQNGEEMPSRRVLSAVLGVNPNTVQKAFKMLEDEGIIQSRTGAKSYISISTSDLKRFKKALVGQGIAASVQSLKSLGLSLEQALDAVKSNWEE